MNTGFDAKRYFHNPTGLGNYSRSLIDTLAEIYPEDNFFLFDQNPGAVQSLPNMHLVTPSFASPFWRINGIRKDIFKNKIEVFHGLSNELPAGKWNMSTRRVVTVHDVLFKEYPDHYGTIDRVIYDRKTMFALNTADRIILTSHSTLQSIRKYYRFDESKTRVVYQTCGREFQIGYSETQIENFRKKYGLPENFILYTSSFQNRKNHIPLIECMNHLKGKDIHLVLAGRKGETWKSCMQLINRLGLHSNITLLMDLGKTEMPLVYLAASAFVYPSISEGFGIPLIEAAFAGLPVLANQNDIFTELAPPGSRLCPIEDRTGFATLMLEIMNRGRMDYGEWLDTFRSEKTAEKVMEIYRELR